MSLILVDGSALVYRAYYAFINRPLKNAAGQETSVVFGFLNSVLRLLETYRPTHLGLAFDVKGKTFRHDLYPEYKANRKPMPEPLAAQIPMLRRILDAWGVTVLEKAGYEADDVIATVARRSQEICDRVWMYTGDKDFLQLLDDRIGMLKPGRRGDDITRVTVAEVKKQYDLAPQDLIEVFALSGDSSDNIPGAPGIGEKTALKLIQQFGSIDSLYAQLQDPSLTPRLRRILEQNKEQVYLSRRLFTIDTSTPLELDWRRLETRLPTGAEFGALLERLELRRLMNLIERLAAAEVAPPAAASAVEPDAVPHAAGEPDAVPESAETEEPAGDDATSELLERGYLICNNDKELKNYLDKIPPGAPLAVDTETDGLRADSARLVGVSLATADSPPIYIPVLIRQEADGQQTAPATLFGSQLELSRLDWVRDRLRPLLSDAKRLKVGQNLKFDEWILTRHGMPVRGDRFDTMVAAYVLDPGRQRYGLSDLAGELLGERMIAYRDLFAIGDRERDILNVPLAKLALYAAEDADVTFRLYELMERQLASEGMSRLFERIEMPLSVVLFRMEHNGIKVDTDFLQGLHQQFSREMASLAKQIQDEAGEPFNVQSPQQLARILFEKLKLKPLKKTATGWSTDVSVLSSLAEQHRLPALVLEHRTLAKLQNTYVESLPQLVNSQTGLIHTSFNQAVAATGRLSSSDPNLQNIPIRTEKGRMIRRAFVPREPGNVLLSADYSQVELRLLAHLSGDENLCRAFREGGDVHRRTAALIAGVAEAAVTPQMRRRAKAINFGVIYGMGARALAKQIGVTTKEAKAFIDTYFATYPGVRNFIDEAKEQGRKSGCTETLLGRRRQLPDIMSANNRVRSFQERIAVNTPIQGTAADAIKLAMIAIDRRLQQERLGTMLLLQVHDELLLEVPRQERKHIEAMVRDCMESVMDLAVPLTVDIHVGDNWAEAHD